MSCVKGKDKCKPEEAKVRCEKCGALAEKKKDVCRPEKLPGADKSDKKAGKKKK